MKPLSQGLSKRRSSLGFGELWEHRRRPGRPRGAKRIALTAEDIQAKGARCFFNNV
jgi:hypothetical protein